MSIEIQFADEHDFLEENDLKQIAALIERAAELEQIVSAEVSITLVNNEEIQKLNKQYRQRDEVTDVLSFPMYGDEATDFILDDEDELLMLGDIIISVERAREQAEEYGHSFLRELGFLAVHGFLHLLGYNHETEEMEQRMFSRQEEILTKHGLLR